MLFEFLFMQISMLFTTNNEMIYYISPVQFYHHQLSDYQYKRNFFTKNVTFQYVFIISINKKSIFIC